jgi:hypothetical protein
VKKATLSTLFFMVLFSLLAPQPAFTQTSPTHTAAPDPKSDSKSEKELNKGLDEGKTSLDYTLDVPSLVDNDHRIFWKQGDSIRVHVTNNPFLFKYSLQFNEQLIKEDDPLSAFGGKFGLNVSNGTSTSGSPDTNTKDKAKVEAALQNAVGERYNLVSLQNAQEEKPADPGFQALNEKVMANILASRSAFAAGDYEAQQQDLKDANDLLEQAQNAMEPGKGGQKEFKIEKTPVPAKDLSAIKSLKENVQELQKSVVISPPTADQLAHWKQRVDKLTSQADAIHTALEAKIQKYQDFSDGLPAQLATLPDPKINVAKNADVILQRAQTIHDEATAELKLLTDGHPDDTGYGSKIDEDQMVDFAQRAAPLHEELTGKLPLNDPEVAQQVNQLLDQLHRDGRFVVADACRYKAKIENDFITIRTGLLDPLDAVLKDGLSFGYVFPNVAKKREGPFVDPTSVTMTLTRTPASPFSGTSTDGKAPKNTSGTFNCSSDTTDLFEYGDTYVTFADFFTDKPVSSSKRSTSTDNVTATPSNLYAKNQNSPQYDSKTADQNPSQSGNGGKNSTKTNSNDDTTVLVQPWLFGKPRLVLSGGVGTALLSKQEFQRSMSISGTTTETVVGLKTNTKIRTTPMLYGHTFLPWLDRRHDPDAWYATFGVTANSDNKGTDPEFLFGLSRSFVQQRFFVTAGAYLGERQKLDGGLYVGEVIPSTFTTDLPVTKSYHTGFAFGISYRFASTKTAQDNTKQPNSGSSKNAN